MKAISEKWKCLPLSHVQLFVTQWTVAHQAPLSMGFSRQEHWSGLPFPTQGNLPDAGMEPESPALQHILYRLSHRGNPHTVEHSLYTKFRHLLCKHSVKGYKHIEGSKGHS